jgi:crotonobetainyl-CoA:carnitine CoA-transferase CaiB-like acyl-CoA transferase
MRPPYHRGALGGEIARGPPLGAFCSETPGSVRAPAPELGQHTELLLTELLGYDWDRVAELRKRGVI